MDKTPMRLTNGRQAIERAGGVGQVAKKMGYSNPSFLVQMFGPNPNRVPSEKTMRKMEKALALANGSLDGQPIPALPPVGTSAIDAVQLGNIIRLVGKLAEEEAVRLSPDRFATLVSMTYDEATEHGGQLRETRIRQVVQLLRGH